MGSVTINGSTSGAITLAAPAVAGSNTLTLPAATGTVITSGSSAALPVAAISATGTPTASNYLRGDGAWAAVSGTPSGAIMPYAGSSAPTDWLLCSGAAVSRTTYAALFAVIGTTYGSGDGSTTFNLPDLRGRSAFGVDNMGGTAANRITSGGSGITGTTLGAAGGAETVTLSTSQIPSHNHYPTNNLGSPGNNGFNGYVYFNFTNSGNAGSSYPMSSTGGGGAHNNTPPAIMLNYIIKT